MMRPDVLDMRNAFNAGYRHGLDVGAVSPREAEAALRQLPTTLPITSDTVGSFCAGNDDGVRRDSFRYILFNVARFDL